MRYNAGTNDFTSFINALKRLLIDAAQLCIFAVLDYPTGVGGKKDIVLLGSLLLCQVFSQRIKDLNLELLVYYRS